MRETAFFEATKAIELICEASVSVHELCSIENGRTKTQQMTNFRLNQSVRWVGNVSTRPRFFRFCIISFERKLSFDRIFYRFPYFLAEIFGKVAAKEIKSMKNRHVSDDTRK